MTRLGKWLSVQKRRKRPSTRLIAKASFASFPLKHITSSSYCTNFKPVANAARYSPMEVAVQDSRITACVLAGHSLTPYPLVFVLDLCGHLLVMTVLCRGHSFIGLSQAYIHQDLPFVDDQMEQLGLVV